MIKYIHRNQLDVEKYDACISYAVNSRIYAYSWYLDIVCDDWNVLVKDDYEAVMPLPIRKKLGISYVYLPPWVQQLGVFSLERLNESVVESFLKAIPKKFKLVELKLNSDNQISSKKISERVNYILSLDTDFKSIVTDYNSNRKRILKADFSKFRIEKKTDPTIFLDFYSKNKLAIELPKDTFDCLKKLVNSKEDAVRIWSVYFNDKLISSLLWLKDLYRITYLLPVNNEQGKKDNASTYLINSLIKEYQNTGLILDFEGSMIKGVASFYKSFGTKAETYYHFKKYRIF
jgi:hypothetical protein